jgi:hypothetical protein
VVEYPLSGDGQHIDLRPGHGLFLSTAVHSIL